MTSAEPVVTTCCRSCLVELAVPLVLFERWTAVYCEMVGQRCQDSFSIRAERGLNL